MKRYDLVGEYDLSVQEVEDGRYVMYDDAAARIRELEEANRVLVSKLKANRHDEEHVPSGFTRIEAWSNDQEIVVIGGVPDEDADPECRLHNCDQMGCGLGVHVIVRIKHPFAALDAARRKG